MRIGNMDIMQSDMGNKEALDSLKNFSELEKTQKIKSPDSEKKAQQADTVAKEFETLYVDMMLKSMRETVKPEEESNAENIYKSMLDSEYSKNMTDAQSFGIRDMVRNWIMENS